MAEDTPATQRRQYGNSRAYIIDRLKRENQTALAAAVQAGTLTAFSAAVQCGWSKRPPAAATVTHQARKRQVRLRAIEGELGPGKKMELQYGPNPTSGSLFNSREELESAWAACRDELMQRANPGRRPAGFYEFEWPDLHRPPYAEERSTLWRRGLLAADEQVTVESEWRAAFWEAQAPDFSLNDGSGEVLMGDCARAAHYCHHDIPRELVRRWTAAARRRRLRRKCDGKSGAQSGASPEKAQENAPGGGAAATWPLAARGPREPS